MQSSHPTDAGTCPENRLCPLSQCRAGAVVCLKRLVTSADMTLRLRELGFLPDQKIRLLSVDSTFICQICNARLAISEKLADSILVQSVGEIPAGTIGT